MPRKQPSKSSDGGGSAKSLPYTTVFLSGMRMGFTAQELKAMSYTRLLNFIDSYNELMTPEKEGEPTVREATQADIQSMLVN
jgi:hypothetical protein